MKDYYGSYSREQIQQANNVDLEALLLRRGETLIRSGHEFRLARDHSITIRGKCWYDHAEEKGGHALSFVRRYYDLTFHEAMQLLLGEGEVVSPAVALSKQEKRKTFALPEAAGTVRRLYAYLLGQRCIDKAVLRCFLDRHLIFEDKPYHNAVFVGTDEEGVPRHGHKRSTNSSGKAFRLNIEGSDPAYSFHWTGNSGKLYVFEAPIDMLSYISMNPENWQQHCYVALCGVSAQALLKQLELQEIRELFLCLDNDAAGQAATKRLTERLNSAGNWKVEQFVPQRKDWNDDLKELCAGQEGGMKLGL